MEEKKHLLIVAHSFLPGANSEGRVGWEFATRLCAFFDVTVVVSEHYSDRLREVEYPPNMEVVFHQIKSLDGMRAGKGVFFPTLYYNLWIKSIPKMLKQKGIDPDIVQHITFVRFTTPSKLYKLGVPTVLGPVGGAEYVPLKFYKECSLKHKLIETIRYWNIRSSAFFFSGARASIKNSDLIFAVTEDTALQCRNVNPSAKVHVYSQLGMSDEELALTKVEKKENNVFRIITAGRLIYWKGFDILIDAYKDLTNKDVELVIIGEGPLKVDFQARTYGLENVTFMGNISREEVFNEFSKSDVFCLPSLHDSGGFVFLEALACGLPVVCMDVGGPGLFVNENCGIKVPISNREKAVEGVAEALLKLIENPELLKKLSLGTQEVIENYKWENKIQIMAKELKLLCP